MLKPDQKISWSSMISSGLSNVRLEKEFCIAWKSFRENFSSWILMIAHFEPYTSIRKMADLDFRLGLKTLVLSKRTRMCSLSISNRWLVCHTFKSITFCSSFGLFRGGPPIFARILAKFSLSEMGGLLAKSKKSWWNQKYLGEIGAILVKWIGSWWNELTLGEIRNILVKLYFAKIKPIFLYV